MCIFIFQGSIKYEVIGDFQAAFYFSVDTDNGQVFVQNDLKQDLATAYTLRVTAYDDASPGRVATATVPIFDQKSKCSSVCEWPLQYCHCRDLQPGSFGYPNYRN